MAHHARKLVEHNGLSHVVEVIQSSVEDLQLPCQVDIIISEWMGYILLRESMLDSVIRARNKWMKPGGSLYPSQATIYLSAISYEEDREGKYQEFINSMKDWKGFSEDMTKLYGVDVSPLTSSYRKEQEEYFIYSGLWTELRPEHVIGQPVVIKHLDLNTCTLKDSEGVDPVKFNIEVPFPVTVSGFAGWFTTHFNGSNENPVQKRVVLSTGPEAGFTHWGQQVSYFHSLIFVILTLLNNGCNFEILLQFCVTGILLEGRG
jgi:protein arginine N-methyltransferase 1